MRVITEETAQILISELRAMRRVFSKNDSFAFTSKNEYISKDDAIRIFDVKLDTLRSYVRKGLVRTRSGINRIVNRTVNGKTQDLPVRRNIQYHIKDLEKFFTRKSNSYMTKKHFEVVGYTNDDKIIQVAVAAWGTTDTYSFTKDSYESWLSNTLRLYYKDGANVNSISPDQYWLSTPPPQIHSDIYDYMVYSNYITPLKNYMHE